MVDAICGKKWTSPTHVCKYVHTTLQFTTCVWYHIGGCIPKIPCVANSEDFIPFVIDHSWLVAM